MTKSKAEETLAQQIQYAGLPAPERQCQFHPRRRWRADFAWTLADLLVEVEGGAWVNGRHTRGSGFVKDIEKYNAATMGGWRLLRFTSAQVENGEALSMIEEALVQWLRGRADMSGLATILALREARASVALDHDERVQTQSENPVTFHEDWCAANQNYPCNCKSEEGEDG